MKKPKANAKAKIKKASQAANDEIAQLLELAASAPALKFKERKSAAKLFELAVLTEVLLTYTATTGGGVRLVNPAGAAATAVRFAGGPASAKKRDFSYVELSDASGTPVGEAWVSVQFSTLSHSLATAGLPVGGSVALSGGPPYQRASLHELDLLVCSPLKASELYPQPRQLLAAFSCKHVSKLAKESVREALGYRREMGFLDVGASGSSSSWLATDVPADPAVPLYLVSSSTGTMNYADHIDQVGVYAAYMRFPLA